MIQKTAIAVSSRRIQGIASAALLLLFVGGCATEPKSQTSTTVTNGIVLPSEYDGPVAHPERRSLVPKASLYNGKNRPIIRHLLTESAAQKFGFKVGDELVSVNSVKTRTAEEFENNIKRSPITAQIDFLRDKKLHSARVILGQTKPRFGAGFEPESVALVKKSSPLVAFMHIKDLTTFAQTSLSANSDEFHVNMIIQSSKPIVTTQMIYELKEKGQLKPFAKGSERLDALGEDSRIISKAIRKPSGLKGPVQLSLNIDRKQFVFEFQ